MLHVRRYYLHSDKSNSFVLQHLEMTMYLINLRMDTYDSLVLDDHV